MPKFDLTQYETVKERKAKFYEDHTDGRIVVSLLNAENPLDYALFVAKVYLTSDDQKNDTPKATGYALEVRDKELSTTKDRYTGEEKQYESVNYSSWTENCEESAVGRALDNAGYSGNKKCSREEIEKSQKMNETMKKVNDKDAQDKGLWCDIHNCAMKLNKNGKPYHRNQAGEFCNGYGFPSDPRPTDSRKAPKTQTENDKMVQDINDDIPF